MFATDLNVLLAMAERLMREGKDEDATALRRIASWVDLRIRDMRKQ